MTNYNFFFTNTQIYTHSDYIDIQEVVLTRLVSDLNAEMLLRLCCEFCCCSSFCNHYNNDNSKNNLIIVRNGNVGSVYVRVKRGEEIDRRVASLSQVAHSRGVRVCERAFCPVTYPGQDSLS